MLHRNLSRLHQWKMRRESVKLETLQCETGGFMRIILIALGWICVFLGMVGIFLPILPTTPFILLAAWLFARASPRFERWLYEHRLFGPPLRAWRDHRSIPRRTKIMAISMMAMSFAILVFVLKPMIWITAVVGAILFSSAMFIATRSEAQTR